ncbi:response regulator [Anaerocolumna xylanovorans]|uniref:Stage 0 sporulation protein A homolog n=1 Tax=Anaerocolumna xylanovorans DSM 12503 TaxID=1121345 RepID=A0A1M7YKZ9_9FIRM|nr:response regulator [Anaerocolumna xylanovorans]SHO53268.1 two-component system, chemotaxis family, response regulator CheY [Anaerocolumna xylanovorans DSM 12503]
MKKILIVDDMVFMRLSIKNMLEKEGQFEFYEASNGMEAVQRYKEFKPDLVTMDITMPDMTGIEALKLIIEYDPKAVVMMISAMGQEAMVRESILSGAKTFIIKPFKEEQMLKTVQKLLSI